MTTPRQQPYKTVPSVSPIEKTCPTVLRAQLLSIMYHRVGKGDKKGEVVAHAVSPCSVSTWPMTARHRPPRSQYPHQSWYPYCSEQQREPQFLTDEQVEHKARAQGIYSISTSHTSMRSKFAHDLKDGIGCIVSNRKNRVYSRLRCA